MANESETESHTPKVRFKTKLVEVAPTPKSKSRSKSNKKQTSTKNTTNDTDDASTPPESTDSTNTTNTTNKDLPPPTQTINNSNNTDTLLEFPSMGKSFFLHAVLPLTCLYLLSLLGNYSVRVRTPSTPVKPKYDLPPSFEPAKSPSSSSNYNNVLESDHILTPEQEEYQLREQERLFREASARRSKSDDTPTTAATATGGATTGGGGDGDVRIPRKKKKEKQTKKQTTLSRAPQHILEQMEMSRDLYESEPNNVVYILRLAESLQQHDESTYGSVNLAEGVELYQKARTILNMKLHDTTTTPADKDQLEQLLLSCEYGLSRMYFQGNMFEKSLEACNNALQLNRNYYAILNFRATTLTILGRYAEAAEDYITILEGDSSRYSVPDAVSGLTKILIAKESIVPGGWAILLDTVEELLPGATETYNELMLQKEAQKENPNYVTLIQQACGPLRRLHYALFNYYDLKTEDVDKAFDNLSLAAHYATMASNKGDDLESNFSFQEAQTASIKQIFSRDFFTVNSAFGHTSRKPVFIIGFYRSGSTLTERVLDAHPDIVGTGEDSVFNNYLEHIRNEIVAVSSRGGNLGATIQTLGDEVIELIENRWEMVSKTKSDTLSEEKSLKPKRYVDKMLSNYRNIGFIHLLFPNALILHVMREPMDVVFSSFKHDFSAGSLDHTNEYHSLAHSYRTYRELIDHWDNALPGRIKHVRYEDMVNDMPGVARAIIKSTGLPWDESVLEFHKKKHAVNTLSSTQVRKGVYKNAIKSWKKYEAHLQPLVKLVGDRVKSNIKTTLPGYKKPPKDFASF